MVKHMIVDTVRYCTTCYWTKVTFTDLRNLMRNFSTFSLACLFYFTVQRYTKLFGPKVK